MKSLLDKEFKYTPAISTDIRERFEKVRDALAEELKRSEALAKQAEQIVAKTRIKGKA